MSVERIVIRLDPEDPADNAILEAYRKVKRSRRSEWIRSHLHKGLFAGQDLPAATTPRAPGAAPSSVHEGPGIFGNPSPAPAEPAGVAAPTAPAAPDASATSKRRSASVLKSFLPEAILATNAN